MAGILFLLVCAWPVRQGLFDSERVLFGIDTATTQLPWSEQLPPLEAGEKRPRNPALGDQGHGFYPLYHWVAASWAEGDAPLWNPLIFCGAPAAGNPQYGIFDPQCWPLVLAWKVGGQEWMDRGLALMAWLRLALAGLGAYALARRLGLGPSGSALSGVLFSLSGYLVLWLNFGLGHVPPLLPWIFYFLEGTRLARPARAAAGVALSLAMACAAGHPETAFFGGVAAGIWALVIWREDRRAGSWSLGGLALGVLVAAPVLLPFVEYLQLSAAKADREQQLTHMAQDPVALGLLIACAGFVLVWRRSARAKSQTWGQCAASVLGLLFGVGALVWVLARRGLEPAASICLVPDVFGAPGDGLGGYFGSTNLTEQGSGWIAAVGLALALAQILGTGGALRRRGLVIALGLCAWLLCLRIPGLLELWRRVPLVGLGDTARFGATSALLLALMAGDALQSATRLARSAAAIGLALAVGAIFFTWQPAPGPQPELEPVAEEDELAGLLIRPERKADKDSIYVEGWIHPSLTIQRVTLVAVQLNAAGESLPATELRIPAELTPTPSARAAKQMNRRGQVLPVGTTYYRSAYIVPDRLSEGTWELSAEFFARGDSKLAVGQRILGCLRVDRPPLARPKTLILGALGLILIVFIRPGSRAGWAIVFLAVLQGYAFAEGKNPAVPTGEVYPATSTERILEREIGHGRFFGEPGVMPPDTGMVRGLRHLDGYEGMRPAAYGAYIPYAIKAGTQRLLGWNARGADLSSPFFRLLGVTTLVLRDPLDDPNWDLIAGPDPAAPESAECYLYSARDPMPRAFCVPEVIGIDGLAQELGSWDPTRVAAIEDGWRPKQPFTQSDVRWEFDGNNRVELEVELDGEGLLVLADQHFPGWEVEVNGNRRELLRVNGLFRGVALEAGTSQVRFFYKPWSIIFGLIAAAIGLMTTVVLLLRR